MPKVLNWFNCNKLHLNAKKSVAMLFYPRQRKINTSDQGIFISNDFIAFSDNTKFLGVIIDKNLTWYDHVSTVSSKVSKAVGIMFKLSRFLPPRVLLTLYNSLVLPYLYHCNVVWGHACSYIKCTFYKRKQWGLFLIQISILIPNPYFLSIDFYCIHFWYSQFSSTLVCLFCH